MATRAFVDRPVTDVDRARTAASAGAQHWGIDPPALIRTGMNAIFRSGAVVLRVSAPTAPAHASLELARCLADRGLRVTQPVRDEVVECDGLSVTAWEFIETTGDPIDWRSVGAAVAKVHAITAADLPPAYPVSTPVAFPWWDFATLLDELGDWLDDRTETGLRDAIGRWPDWSNGENAVICHGDVHPGNVIMSSDGPVLIDWDLLCSAPAGWDHAPMMTHTERWGGADGLYEAFAEGYGRSMRGDRQAEAFAELRLVAATLMRLRAGLRNEAAMPEAQRRLAYWRGESDAPMWQAQ
jgi:Ser/Thr protein kinase RdoA (MazF antagonist)